MSAGKKGKTTPDTSKVEKNRPDKQKPELTQTTDQVSYAHAMMESALSIIRKCNLKALLIYVDGLASLDELELLDFKASVQIILIARNDSVYEKALEYTDKVVRVPQVSLTRISQIKLAVMLSFSNRFLEPGDKFIFLAGLPDEPLDTMMILEVGREYEMFQSVDQPPLTEHIRRAVFERVFSLALELAAEGREGKPIGVIFVLGDSNSVIENSRQMIMNPFKGYPESERNILDDQMKDTIKEFSAIDGAIIIKGTGVVVSAGTYLLPRLVCEDLPQGLGARHVAAAAITAATRSIAISISESTGTVRIWRQGKMITEIEKAKHKD